jgi:hypothetical protein
VWKILEDFARKILTQLSKTVKVIQIQDGARVCDPQRLGLQAGIAAAHRAALH